MSAEGIYADEGDEKSDLYNEEPLYQKYHDIATARALVVQSSCFGKLRYVDYTDWCFWLLFCDIISVYESLLSASTLSPSVTQYLH